MSSQPNNPIDYKTFKRRARRFENLRAFAVSFAFDAFLVAIFAACICLIHFGGFWR